jgi:hypothetical protein
MLLTSCTACVDRSRMLTSLCTRLTLITMKGLSSWAECQCRHKVAMSFTIGRQRALGPPKQKYDAEHLESAVTVMATLLHIYSPSAIVNARSQSQLTTLSGYIRALHMSF